jgi:predicted nucleotidyltransferase
MGLREIFRTMIDFFARERIKFALIGAFGLHAFGYTRATRDIDFITSIENQETIVRYLSSLGFETLQRTTAFSNHQHPVGGARVDIMYVEGATANRIFSSAKNGIVYDDIELPVVSPEHLIALKLFAAYNDHERKYRELADIHEIMRRVQVDRNAVRSYFKKYGFEENYEEVAGKEL